MTMKLTDYLGAEETNLVVSLVNFRVEFDLFSEVDGIYQAPLGRLRLPSEDEPGLLIGQLYLFVHFHLYFSITCILRSHLSESFSSSRKAIDAGLSAYKIILEPDTWGKYLESDRYFQFIKSNLQTEIKKDPAMYPLAHKLIQVHETCSEYGSHADISSFIHRLAVKEVPGTSTDLLQLHYFQFPQNKKEYQFYFVLTLQIFMHIFEIFRSFFDSRLIVIDREWLTAIAKVNNRLEELRTKYYSSIEH
jgi:hypothetical protein